MNPTVTQYHALDWATIRVQPMKKAPVGQWQDRTDGPEDFLPGENIGVRLGDPSGGLVDIDLDCPEALALAPHFLPETATFGRASKPRSHWIYRCLGAKTRKPPRAHVELRSTGTQTVFPGSIHESGEPILWTDSTPIATIGEAALLAAFGKLATATVISRAWPHLDGNKHDTVLALAGALWREGWTLDAALGLLLPPMELDGSSEPHREAAIRDTWEDHGRNRHGWPTVAQLLGPLDGKALERLVQDPSHGFSPDTPTAVAAQRAGYVCNDGGNVDRLEDRCGENIRFVPGLGWLRWDRSRWASSDGPYPEFETLARETRDEGINMGGEAGRALEAWGRQSGNAGRLKGAVEVASHRPSLRVDVGALDANPMLFNASNGIVDLETGRLLPHAREHMITKCAGVPYDPNARAPRFAQFLREVFGDDTELAAYVLRYLGSALAGTPADRVFQVWHGSGANGKSTLIDTIRFVLGDYGITVPAGLLLASRHQRNSAAASPDLVAMRGVRWASCVETDAGQRWNESLVKQLTGGDRIRARALYKDTIEFESTWSLVLATNHKPLVRGTDAAIWDRIHLVPFEVAFLDPPSGPVEVGRARYKDPRLRDALRSEGPGILAALVSGCLEWQRGGLRVPARVKAAVDDYRESQDVVGAFLTECCDTGPDYRTRCSDMYRAYKLWAADAGEFVHGKHSFNRILRERGLVDAKDRAVEWRGVRLASKARFGAVAGVPQFP